MSTSLWAAIANIDFLRYLGIQCIFAYSADLFSQIFDFKNTCQYSSICIIKFYDETILNSARNKVVL